MSRSDRQLLEQLQAREAALTHELSEVEAELVSARVDHDGLIVEVRNAENELLRIREGFEARRQFVGAARRAFHESSPEPIRPWNRAVMWWLAALSLLAMVSCA